jgi:hypothetical protein
MQDLLLIGLLGGSKCVQAGFAVCAVYVLYAAEKRIGRSCRQLVEHIDIPAPVHRNLILEIK